MTHAEQGLDKLDTPPQEVALPIIHRKPWGSWILGGVVVLGLALLLWMAWERKIIDGRIFATYLLSPAILSAAAHAVMLGTLALLLACGIGFISALMRLSSNPILYGLSATYVYFFRGTPMLIQLLFWFNAVPTIFPRIYIALPWMDAPLVNVSRMCNVIATDAARHAGHVFAYVFCCS